MKCREFDIRAQIQTFVLEFTGGVETHGLLQIHGGRLWFPVAEDHFLDRLHLG
jgi:hypothetical protein